MAEARKAEAENIVQGTETSAGGHGSKMKLLALIGADLAGKVTALRESMLMAGAILVVIGAVWLTKQAACCGEVCEKSEVGRVEEKPRDIVTVKGKAQDFVEVARVEELHDQWGRAWVVKGKERGLEQERRWTANAAPSSGKDEEVQRWLEPAPAQESRKRVGFREDETMRGVSPTRPNLAAHVVPGRPVSLRRDGPMLASSRLRGKGCEP